MKVLSVASEVFPLVKTGGLADVAGALPLALSRKGVETRTLVPGYPAVLAGLHGREPLWTWPDLFGGRAELFRAAVGGLDLLVLGAPHLFDRPGGIYADGSGRDWDDNWRRFAALARAGADIAEGHVGDWRPDLVHAHDWQAGLTPAYMSYGGAWNVPSVMTVHNLAFQGSFGPEIFPALGLPPHAMSIHGVEYYGAVSFLKAGLQKAWTITTVSPTYAQEIRTPAFGMGLQGLINSRAADLHGIVNGIDVDIWNPETDAHLAARYSAETLHLRAQNRQAVERRFGLEPSDEPILCVVSRLTWQKGMDILASLAEAIVRTGARLAVLGSGDAGLERALLNAAARQPGRIGVVIGYDEALSHLLQGGADGILIPSRFEPCGLTQLYGLRYGCVPLVARTGGLADTVIDANEAALAAGVATGFQFAPDSGDALLHGVGRAVAAHRAAGVWASLQRQGMKADVSWARSADRYVELYRMLVQGRTAQG